MKLCFNEATTLENSNLEKDLTICEQNGYDYIEIRTMDKLPEYLKTHTLDDLATYFQNHHIKPLALNALVFFNNRDEAGHATIIQEFQEMMHICDKIGAKYVVAVPLVTTEKILKKDIKQSCIEVLQELSNIAESHGVKIALEFVGHPECTVNTFEDAYDIVQAVNRDNVGLVFDSFHFHAMGSNIENLKNADSSKIFIFHIDDTEDFQIGLLTDDDRVWPGHGAIDLEAHITTLKQIGYSDVVSVELFRPEYYQLTPEETIEKAKTTTLEVISKYY
ncbi:2-keto-myo-inositol isomerase [Listeria booriae]|uniref:2-keto-myo-inositol isomerase n=1 Tax=Listeria booriae TaxID=1552123 RepID=A0A7X0XDD7_9LIST|nr:2-keto-myo-inositol isomerase [Listeria booriae]MBC1491863.1 2-keto-myo-inositol isomerase [Listeria booriae]MBC1503090.1 2-keto-myo-inositol isomerase [Listeria booriae]MBC1512018.1 2-keto-myo-inositol isomerase [Listeria booriae]MBC1524203.1 2-keto-myo-inositol isomerase [Listeria booriae]MBC1530256.1 2-keto-myo-inositol isomerase [Listeria booriae]